MEGRGGGLNRDGGLINFPPVKRGRGGVLNRGFTVNLQLPVSITHTRYLSPVYMEKSCLGKKDRSSSQVNFSKFSNSISDNLPPVLHWIKSDGVK